MGVYYIVFVVLLHPATQPGCSETPVPGATGQQILEANQCKIYNHYAPFILIGILAWNFTAGSIMAGMNSILGNASIIKKVYFPREVLTISSVLAQFVNFLLALIPLCLIILGSGLLPSGLVLILPIIFVAHILFLVGLALIVSIAVLYMRDLALIVEVLLQAWFFLSPVLYVMDQVFPTWKQVVYWLNPIASFIEIYRALLFFNYTPDLGFTARTCLTGVGVFIIGYAFFMYKRKRIGELI